VRAVGGFNHGTGHLGQNRPTAMAPRGCSGRIFFCSANGGDYCETFARFADRLAEFTTGKGGPRPIASRNYPIPPGAEKRPDSYLPWALTEGRWRAASETLGRHPGDAHHTRSAKKLFPPLMRAENNVFAKGSKGSGRLLYSLIRLGQSFAGRSARKASGNHWAQGGADPSRGRKFGGVWLRGFGNHGGDGQFRMGNCCSRRFPSRKEKRAANGRTIDFIDLTTSGDSNAKQGIPVRAIGRYGRTAGAAIDRPNVISNGYIRQ